MTAKRKGTDFDDLPPKIQAAGTFMCIIYGCMTVCTSYACYVLVHTILKDAEANVNAWAGAGAVVGVILSYICLRCVDAITEYYIDKENG